METQQNNGAAFNNGMMYNQPVYPGGFQQQPYYNPMQGGPIGMVPPQQYQVSPQFGNPMYQQQAAPLAGAGFVYGNSKPANFTNPLGPSIKERLKSGKANSINIDQEAIDRAVCTHRDANRFYLQSTHNPDAPNEYKCAICGATFEPVDAEPEQIHQLCKEMLDCLHTAKTEWVNLPDNVAIELFQIIAVIEKLDQIWAIASEQYNNYVNPQQLGQIWHDTNNIFSAYDAIVGSNPMVGMPMTNQFPSGGFYQPQQQQMMQQPQSIYANTSMDPNLMNFQAQAMTAAAPGMASNGFGFTAPQQMQQMMPNQQFGNMNTQMSAPQTTPADNNVPADAPVVTKQLQA